jgi:hypothetical protein
MSQHNGNDPTKVVQMGQLGNPEEINLVHNSAIVLVPAGMYPILSQMLHGMAAQANFTQGYDRQGWWWLSFVDVKQPEGQRTVGCYYTMALTPYEALIKVYQNGSGPANGFIEVVAFFYGFDGEQSVPTNVGVEAIQDRWMMPEEAEAIQWTGSTTR